MTPRLWAAVFVAFVGCDRGDVPSEPLRPAPAEIAAEQSDEERMAMLKPVMTGNEVQEFLAGKGLWGDFCGYDGNGGGFARASTFHLTGSPARQLMVWYYQQPPERAGRISSFDGPGFTYHDCNAVYVRQDQVSR